jgi:NTE family protein
LSYLYKNVQVSSFEELQIPLSVVTTDFWKREQVVFESGELRPAIQASMAIPGIFTPTKFNGAILVDGGAVNPVPFDLLLDKCDFSVAIDVAGKRSPKKAPTFFDTVFNTFGIMQQSIVAEKLRHQQPDILIRPEIVDIRALEFYKLASVFEQARPAKEQLKHQLARYLEKA